MTTPTDRVTWPLCIRPGCTADPYGYFIGFTARDTLCEPHWEAQWPDEDWDADD